MESTFTVNSDQSETVKTHATCYENEDIKVIVSAASPNKSMDGSDTPYRTPLKSITELQKNNDQTNDEEFQTPAPHPKTFDQLNIKGSSSVRRSSMIHVRENRATELRRASIRKSMTKSESSSSNNYFTPKKPIGSSSLVKGVNSIVRVIGLKGDETPVSMRKGLDTTNLEKLAETPNKSFSHVIDGMNMFNVVTDEMKKVGPSTYLSQKFGTSNSPRRTPKKLFKTHKRQSLRSEVRCFAKIMDVNNFHLYHF